MYTTKDALMSSGRLGELDAIAGCVKNTTDVEARKMSQKTEIMDEH